MSKATEKINKELSSLEPDAIIELFEIDFSSLQNHVDMLKLKDNLNIGSEAVYRFHAGKNLSNPIIWQDHEYQPLPIVMEDMESRGDGTLPRPKLSILNIDGLLSKIISSNDDFVGCTVTRKRTFAKFLDSQNFQNRNTNKEGKNPFGRSDPQAHLPDDIFFVNRKIAETKDVLQFELSSALELGNTVLPGRVVMADYCTWKYRCSVGCRYGLGGDNGLPRADVNDKVFVPSEKKSKTENEVNVGTFRNVFEPEIAEGWQTYWELNGTDPDDDWYANVIYFKGDQVNHGIFTNSTCVTTLDSPTVTMDDTSNLLAGMAVSGAGVPAWTSVLSITDSTTFVMSENATAGSCTDEEECDPVVEPVAVPFTFRRNYTALATSGPKSTINPVTNISWEGYGLDKLNIESMNDAYEWSRHGIRKNASTEKWEKGSSQDPYGYNVGDVVKISPTYAKTQVDEVPMVFVCTRSHSTPSQFHPLNSKDVWVRDNCSRSIHGCMLRFGYNNTGDKTGSIDLDDPKKPMMLPFGGFPGTSKYAF